MEVPLELALLNGGKRKGAQNDHVQKPKGKTGEPAVARGQQEVSDHLADSHEDRSRATDGSRSHKRVKADAECLGGEVRG